MPEFLNALFRFALPLAILLTIPMIGFGLLLLYRPAAALRLLFRGGAVVLIIGGAWLLISWLAVRAKAKQA